MDNFVIYYGVDNPIQTNPLAKGETQQSGLNVINLIYQDVHLFLGVPMRNTELKKKGLKNFSPLFVIFEFYNQSTLSYRKLFLLSRSISSSLLRVIVKREIPPSSSGLSPSSDSIFLPLLL